VSAQGILGEVLDEGRRLHTSTGEWVDGQAIDAGTAQIVDSNLSQLARESLHHLGTAFGPGQIGSQIGTGYASLIDLAPETNAISWPQSVAWVQSAGLCWGPFDLTQDRVTTDGNMLRKVRIYVDTFAGTGSSLTVYGAITQGAGIPRDSNTIAVNRAVASNGRGTVTFELAPTRVTPSARRSRATPTESAAFLDLYVWLYFAATDANDAIYSASCWETRA
jgi:hypothetical protein